MTYKTKRRRRNVPSMEQRFWSRVDKNGPVPEARPELGQCWIWLGARRGGRYGHLLDDEGRSVAAYRFAYELQVGSIPDGMSIDHLCFTPECVNPRHLEPVTQAINNARSNARVTHCPRGHAYDEANTYVRANGGRLCRACHRERELIRKHRKEAA